MKQKNWPVRLAGIVMSALILAGMVSALAAQGDENDPLVTLSYLTGNLTPKLEQQVAAQVAANEAALVDKLNAAIDAYAAKLGTQSPAGFQTVTLAQGQALSAAAGAELILLAGSATATVNLINTTAGNVLYTGSALVASHLYVAETAGGVRAADAVTVMVRGTYTIG